MELKDILILADQLVFMRKGRHLTDLEQAILQGTIENQTYSEIANKYHCSSGHLRYVASELWQVISDQLGENIKKSNFIATVKRLKIDNIKNHENHSLEEFRHQMYYESDDAILKDSAISIDQITPLEFKHITINQLKELIKQTVIETIAEMFIDLENNANMNQELQQKLLLIKNQQQG